MAEQPINDFPALIERLAAKIILAAPKILGLSVSGASELRRRLVNLVRAARPDITIIVGGFSCYQPSIDAGVPGMRLHVHWEADLTVGKL